MSIQNLQKKLDHAHKKVGQMTGYSYNIYRPLNNIDVMDDSNFVGTAHTFTTLNDEASRNMEFQLPTWTCYTDATLVKQGDFLYSPDENRTLLILIRKPLEPVLAIEVNDRCDISKVGYANTGSGYGPVDDVFLARNVPCWVNYSNRELLGKGSMPGHKTLANAGVRTANITTSLPKTMMIIGHTITDSYGFRGSITEYSYNSVHCGLQLKATEYEAQSG